MRGWDVEFAALYLEGRKLEDHLPEFLVDDWEDVTKKMRAFKRAHATAKVNMEENCFYDLVPTRFLVEFCEVKNAITEYIFKKQPRPARYGFYKHVHMMLRDMEEYKVSYDKKLISSFTADKKLGGHARNILRSRQQVSYNQFGTITGRLTTRRQSFPILTLPRVFRKAIKPNNDMFVELDFNGAEIRTLLGILERDQPEDDIHIYHLKNVFEGLPTRSSAKEAFFAWLYGSKKSTTDQQSQKLDGFYDKSQLLEAHYKDNTITTPYGKVIKGTSPHHALNYLIQSTTAELVLKQALKIHYYLRTYTSSNLSFIIHDALVLDLRKEDLHHLDNIKKLMSSTNFGTYKINSSAGKNLGELTSG
ncbi:MAG TPA: hypothetical protein DF712_07740 [Balneola sp.]|nr:hypothetical protein [Balneola sp.]